MGFVGHADAAPAFPTLKDVPEWEVTLRVVLLSASLETAAQWMLEYDGQPGGLEKRLLAEADQGKMDEVARISITGKPGVLKKESPERVEYYPYDAAGQCWSNQERARMEGMSATDPKIYLVPTHKKVGTSLEATLVPVHGHAAVDLMLKFSHAVKAEERPTPNWPLPAGFSAPRVMFREWRVEGEYCLSHGVPVLLGAQMEPPMEGGVNTGRVWFALAQQDSSPQRIAGTGPLSLSSLPLEVGVTTWLFSLPEKVTVPWLMGRKNSSNDAEFLRSCLSAEGVKKGITLSGVMHSLQGKKHRGVVESRRFWEDATGFEPGGGGPSARAVPCEGDFYELSHLLAVQASPVESNTGPATDVFAPRKPVAISDPIRLEGTVGLPPHAARWTRLESGMERDSAKDPGALELAALGEEEVHMSAEVFHGQAVVLGAWPHADRTRVAIGRCHFGQGVVAPEVAPVMKEAVEGPLGSVWLVDTEAAPWLPPLLQVSHLDDMKLADEVLKSLVEGKARFAGVLFGDSDGVSRQGGGYLGGSLNTHPYADGLPYNPRSFTRLGPGREWRVSDDQSTHDGAWFNVSLTDQTAPDHTRRWGARLAQHVDRTPQDSGVNLPVQSLHALGSSVFVPWGRSTVLGVVQYEDAGVKRLRWSIMLAGPGDETSRNLAAFPAPNAASQWLQTCLVSLQNKDVAELTSDPHAAQTLLPQSLLNGRSRILDMVTVPVRQEGRHGFASGTAGTKTTYLETRGAPAEVDWEHPDIPTMPPEGTVYAQHLSLREHHCGIELSLSYTDLKLTHDGPFKVVTDTLPGYYEFPDQHPKRDPVSVSVERPIFTAHKSESQWPLKELPFLLIPWNGTAPPDGETWFFMVRSLSGTVK